MVNVNNYGTRYLSSVNYGRANIWNRYENHSQMLFNRTLARGPAPPLFDFRPTPYFGCGFGWGGGFMKSFMIGSVIAQAFTTGANLVKNWFFK